MAAYLPRMTPRDRTQPDDFKNFPCARNTILATPSREDLVCKSVLARAVRTGAIALGSGTFHHSRFHIGCSAIARSEHVRHRFVRSSVGAHGYHRIENPIRTSLSTAARSRYTIAKPSRGPLPAVTNAKIVRAGDHEVARSEVVERCVVAIAAATANRKRATRWRRRCRAKSCLTAANVAARGLLAFPLQSSHTTPAHSTPRLHRHMVRRHVVA
jgi:hypothetical protein